MKRGTLLLALCSLLLLGALAYVRGWVGGGASSETPRAQQVVDAFEQAVAALPAPDAKNAFVEHGTWRMAGRRLGEQGGDGPDLAGTITLSAEVGRHSGQDVWKLKSRLRMLGSLVDVETETLVDRALKLIQWRNVRRVGSLVETTECWPTDRGYTVTFHNSDPRALRLPPVEHETPPTVGIMGLEGIVFFARLHGPGAANFAFPVLVPKGDADGSPSVRMRLLQVRDVPSGFDGESGASYEIQLGSGEDGEAVTGRVRLDTKTRDVQVVSAFFNGQQLHADFQGAGADRSPAARVAPELFDRTTPEGTGRSLFAAMISSDAETLRGLIHSESMHAAREARGASTDTPAETVDLVVRTLLRVMPQYFGDLRPDAARELVANFSFDVVTRPGGDGAVALRPQFSSLDASASPAGVPVFVVKRIDGMWMLIAMDRLSERER